MAQIEADRRPSGGPAGNQFAAGFQGSDTLLRGRLAVVLDDDVYAFSVGDLSDLVGDLLLVVIDAVVGSQSACLLKLRFVAGSRNHAAVKQPGNLDGGDAHT